MRVVDGKRLAGLACLLGVVAATSGCGDEGDGAASSTDPLSTGTRPSASAVVRLRDVAAERGLTRRLVSGGAGKTTILENIGTGCALLDADGDGRLDVFLANAGTLESGRVVPGPGTALYLQREDGAFHDATVESGLAFDGWSTGVAVGDFDGDGDPDIFLGVWGPDRLYENRGGRFLEIAGNVGVNSAELSSSAVFLDYDRDGLLDLYVARYVRFDPLQPPNDGKPCLEGKARVACGPTYYEPASDSLYRNEGSGRFRDVSKEAGIADAPGSYGLGVAIGDFDDDGRTDIYVANDTTANFLWMRRENRYEDDALLAGAALSDEGQGQAGMGVAVGEADGDGQLDIFVTNYSQERNALYGGLGDGFFADRSTTSGLAEESYLTLGWSANFSDLDNDGDSDLFVANGHVHPGAAEVHQALNYHQRCLVYINDGSGGFTESGRRLGDDVTRARGHRGTAVGDIDNDGDLDVLVTVQDGPPVLLLNESTGAGHSIQFELRGTSSCREGIGARVTLRIAGREQIRFVSRGGGYLSSNVATVHFGTGDASRIDEIEVRWPRGTVDRVGPLATAAVWRIVEGTGTAERVARR